MEGPLPAVARLTPKQKEIAAFLGIEPPHRKPVFPTQVCADLREFLEGAVEQAAAEISGERPLFVGKTSLTQALLCRGGYLANRQEPFDWNIPLVKGRLAHRAIEKRLLSNTPRDPIGRVDDAIEYFKRDDGPIGLREFLLGLDPEDMHDLRRDAVDLMTKFDGDWPPIPRSLAPRVETSVRLALAQGRIRVTGRIDLLLGVPKGNAAESVILDFKSGNEKREHREDLHFYALIETLRAGVPPWRIASYYLDSGALQTEEVSIHTLLTAARRLVDGIHQMIEAHKSGFDAAERTPGSYCLWCPALHRCGAGMAWNNASQRSA